MINYENINKTRSRNVFISYIVLSLHPRNCNNILTHELHYAATKSVSFICSNPVKNPSPTTCTEYNLTRTTLDVPSCLLLYFCGPLSFDLLTPRRHPRFHRLTCICSSLFPCSYPLHEKPLSAFMFHRTSPLTAIKPPTPPDVTTP